MKKIFILYNIDGKTLAMNSKLALIIQAIRILKTHDNVTNMDDIWVNQYGVGEDCISFPAATVLEEYVQYPDIEDLSSIISS